MRRRDADSGPLLDREASRRVSGQVRELRAAAGLLQADVAAATGVSQAMVCKLERGHCRWREADAAKAAALLGTTLEELLGEGGR